MNSDQIKAMIKDESSAFAALKCLLKNPENVDALREYASEDVRFARFCERIDFKTYSNWRQLCQLEHWKERCRKAEEHANLATS